MLTPLRRAIRPMERTVSKPDSFVGELTENDLPQEHLKIKEMEIDLGAHYEFDDVSHAKM